MKRTWRSRLLQRAKPYVARRRARHRARRPPKQPPKWRAKRSQPSRQLPCPSRLNRNRPRSRSRTRGHRHRHRPVHHPHTRPHRAPHRAEIPMTTLSDRWKAWEADLWVRSATYPPSAPTLPPPHPLSREVHLAVRNRRSVARAQSASSRQSRICHLSALPSLRSCLRRLRRRSCRLKCSSRRSSYDSRALARLSQRTRRREDCIPLYRSLSYSRRKLVDLPDERIRARMRIERHRRVSRRRAKGSMSAPGVRPAHHDAPTTGELNGPTVAVRARTTRQSHAERCPGATHRHLVPGNLLATSGSSNTDRLASTQQRLWPWRRRHLEVLQHSQVE